MNVIKFPVKYVNFCIGQYKYIELCEVYSEMSSCKIMNYSLQAFKSLINRVQPEKAEKL